MRKYNIILLTIIQISLFSCNNGVRLKEQHLKFDNSLNQLSDSSYLMNIKSINYKGGKIYLADNERSQIIVLNKDYSLDKYIGSKGNGPGELLNLSKIVVTDDTIYAYNGGKISIEVFEQTSHIKTIMIPNSLRTTNTTTFNKSNNYLGLSSVNSNNTSIALYNLASGDVKMFGNTVRYNTVSETIRKNKKNILSYKNYIIAVPDNRYSIELYDDKTNFIKEINYSSINKLLKTNNYIENQPKDPMSYYVVIPDAQICGDYLYLMLLTYDVNIGKMQSNWVLEIKLNEDFTATRLLDLGDGWFETICAFDNTLLAYDSLNGNLVSYKIN